VRDGKRRLGRGGGEEGQEESSLHSKFIERKIDASAAAERAGKKGKKKSPKGHEAYDACLTKIKKGKKWKMYPCSKTAHVERKGGSLEEKKGETRSQCQPSSVRRI